MKCYTKFSCLVLTLLLSVAVVAQENPPQPDEGMDVFLLTIATIFAGTIVGAAVVGAFAAAFAIGLVGLFFAIGLLSVSFLVGLYQRSLSAGFKTFIILVFVGIGSLTGIAASFVIEHYFVASLPAIQLFSIGLAAGAVGGLLFGIATFKVLRTSLAFLTKKITG